MTDPVIRQAILLRDRLNDTAKELRMRRDGLAALNEFYACACVESALMLEKLGTEVDRLRQAIGCYKYGRLERSQLYDISDTWNEIKPKNPKKVKHAPRNKA